MSGRGSKRQGITEPDDKAHTPRRKPTLSDPSKLMADFQSTDISEADDPPHTPSPKPTISEADDPPHTPRTKPTIRANRHLMSADSYRLSMGAFASSAEGGDSVSRIPGNKLNWQRALNTRDNIMIEQLLNENKLPNQRHLQRAYDLYKDARLSVHMMDSICKNICDHIIIKNAGITSVKACYKANNPKMLVFVAMAEKEIKVDLEYAVKVIHPNGYSKEGTFITYHKERREKKFTLDESKEIFATIQEHAQELFNKHSNLQIIDGCSVKSHSYGTNNATIVKQTCIVLYVNVKGLIPLHETHLPAHLSIPGTTISLSVDVREGGMRFYGKPGEYHQELKMGCQITDGKKAGTAGAVFEKNGKVFCLTSAHVFFGNEQFRDILQITGTYKRDKYSPLYHESPHPAYDIPVYQNDPVPDQKIGVVTEAVLQAGNTNKAGMDIAIIELTEANRLPTEGSFPDGNQECAGFTVDQPMVYTTGRVYNGTSFCAQTNMHNEVVKYGSETEITRGIFDIQGPCVKRIDFVERKDNNQRGWKLNNQLTVISAGNPYTNPFSKHGDSGALVFAKHGGKWSDLRAVGIIEGEMTNHKTVVTPIWDILDTLNISTEHGLKPFDGPKLDRNDRCNVSTDTSSHTSTAAIRSSDESYQELQNVKKDLQRLNDKFEDVLKQNATLENKLDLILSMIGANNK